MNDIRHRDGYYSIIAKAVRALDRNRSWRDASQLFCDDPAVGIFDKLQ